MIDNTTHLFEENRKLEGYNVKVLDDWGLKVKKRFITPYEKDLYEKQIGNKMITDNEFFDWWCKVNKVGKYAQSQS